jgi:hypothetical protein
MKTLANIIVILLIAISLTSAVQAADINFSASVEQTTVGLGEQFALTVTVQGEGMASVPKPQLPDLPDFNLLGSSSSQSTNISIINGSMKKQATVNFIYYLSPKKLGQLTIGPCKIEYEGQTYKSQPIGIEVAKTTQARPQQAGQSPQPSQSRVPIEGNLFLSAQASRKTVYQGEQVNVEFSLYNRFQINGVGDVQFPSFSGFWPEKIYDADKLNFQARTVDGKQYNVALLKKTALFPVSAGDIEIKPMSMSVGVVQGPRDFFDMFGTTQTVKVESKSLTIKVLPLPEEGKPQEFTGGVGSFAIKASLDRTETTGSEPINLTVTVTGTGNIRLIEKPVMSAIPGLKILDPEIKDNIQTSGQTVKGSKIFRYPVIPQTDGQYVIPPIKMAYFDPVDKKYHTIQTGQFQCTASGCTQSAPLVEATGLKVLGTDISYIKPEVKELPVQRPAPAWLLATIYLLSLAMIGSSLAYDRHQQRLASDRGYQRKHLSSGLVKKRLKQTQSLLDKKDLKNFYSSLSHAVLGYVGDRYNLDTHALTKEQLQIKLTEKGLAPETINEVVGLLEKCETAVYSPGSATESGAGLLLESAREVLNKL